MNPPEWLTALRQKDGTGPGENDYPMPPRVHPGQDEALGWVERRAADSDGKYERVLLRTIEPGDIAYRVMAREPSGRTSSWVATGELAHARRLALVARNSDAWTDVWIETRVATPWTRLEGGEGEESG